MQPRLRYQIDKTTLILSPMIEASILSPMIEAFVEAIILKLEKLTPPCTNSNQPRDKTRFGTLF